MSVEAARATGVLAAKTPGETSRDDPTRRRRKEIRMLANAALPRQNRSTFLRPMRPTRDKNRTDDHLRHRKARRGGADHDGRSS